MVPAPLFDEYDDPEWNVDRGESPNEACDRWGVVEASPRALRFIINGSGGSVDSGDSLEIYCTTGGSNLHLVYCDRNPSYRRSRPLFPLRVAGSHLLDADESNWAFVASSCVNCASLAQVRALGVLAGQRELKFCCVPALKW